MRGLRRAVKVSIGAIGGRVACAVVAGGGVLGDEVLQLPWPERP